VYGAPEVKRQLVEDQHGKCCFCESKVGTDGDVEHFRPKGGWRQVPTDPLTSPGYYWLAYDWDNLFLCCSACNTRNKRNLFPLRDPLARATAHTGDLTREDPLFLNPAACDPEAFIGFRAEIPYPIDDNLAGKETIASLGLAREILNERRRDRLALLRRLQDLVMLLERKKPHEEEAQRIIDRAEAELAQATADTAEFAAMARLALR
jgi:uncharacterized protein (TIGR02646 family)